MARPVRPPLNDDDLDELHEDHAREDVFVDMADEDLDGDDLDELDSPVEDFDFDAGDELHDLSQDEAGEPFDEPFDEGIDEWSLVAEDVAVPVPPPAHLVAVKWSTRAELPALQLDLPAVLDPTRPDSEWRVAEAPDADHIDVRLRLGSIEVRVALRVVQGEPAGLVLGRDVLSGRILVQS